MLTRRFTGGTSHEEIFTFRRLLGTSRGREYEKIVKPVVEKWGAYVCQFVSRTAAA